MIFQNNSDFRRLVKSASALQGLTLAALAERMHTTPQQLQNILNKKQLAFVDAVRIASALGMALSVDFVPQPDSIAPAATPDNR